MAVAKEDRQSRVPHRTYGTELSVQEAELAADPLLARFAEARQTLRADRHRPRYHFVNPEGPHNDPNGLCRWQGRWHLFYQGYPPEDPRVHWGHAVSPDLVHWRDLPYAIYPDPEVCCFSGSTLVEPERVIAMYHGTEVGNMVATADDPLLLNWTKVGGAAVIPLAAGTDSQAPFRIFDPCIWKQDGVYYSLSGCSVGDGPGGKHRRDYRLFRSDDLATWEHLHPFVENDGYGQVGDDGACPYFWPLGEKHILLTYSHRRGGQYLLGDYDTERQKFIVTDGGSFNFGAFGPCGVHAPSAAPDGEGGVVALFNMNAGAPTAGWNQIMTLPRRLSLDPTARFSPLRIEPWPALAALRGEHHHVSERTLAADNEWVVPGVSGTSLELRAVFRPGAAPVELNVLRAPDGGERTRILFLRDGSYPHRELGWSHPDGWTRDSAIVLDPTTASRGAGVRPRPPETATVFLAGDEPVELRIFVDRSVVEVFVNGRQAIACRVYPAGAESRGVSLLSRGGETAISSLDTWEMGSLYG